jgi:hypothetical protein
MSMLNDSQMASIDAHIYNAPCEALIWLLHVQYILRTGLQLMVVMVKIQHALWRIVIGVALIYYIIGSVDSSHRLFTCFSN